MFFSCSIVHGLSQWLSAQWTHSYPRSCQFQKTMMSSKVHAYPCQVAKQVTYPWAQFVTTTTVVSHGFCCREYPSYIPLKQSQLYPIVSPATPDFRSHKFWRYRGVSRKVVEAEAEHHQCLVLLGDVLSARFRLWSKGVWVLCSFFTK